MNPKTLHYSKPTEEKFTPGPWRVYEEGDHYLSKYGSIELLSDKAMPITDGHINIDREARRFLNDDAPKSLFVENTKKGGIWWRNKYDAYLASVSPEMYNLLKTIAESSTMFREPIEQLLRRARGEYGEKQ